MSHIVTIKTEVRDAVAVQAACRRLGLSQVDQAIEALRRLGEALRQADSAETKELLNSLITRIERARVGG